jgi:NagD protein
MKATEKTLKHIRKKQAFIIDMDGVIYHGNVLLPGAAQFVDWLKREASVFCF